MYMETSARAGEQQREPETGCTRAGPGIPPWLRHRA